MENRQMNLWSLLSAFAIGGLIGAGVMAILAPQSGTETRELLMNKGQQLKDRALKTTNQTGKMIGDFTQQAMDRATNVFRHGQDIAEGYKSNIEEEAKSKSVQFGNNR